MHTQRSTPHDIVRDVVARVLGAIGLLGIALIHLLDVVGKFAETPYLGWMYVGAIAASIGLAGWLVARGSSPVVWAATGGLALSILTGFVLSRTTGSPSSRATSGTGPRVSAWHRCWSRAPSSYSARGPWPCCPSGATRGRHGGRNRRAPNTCPHSPGAPAGRPALLRFPFHAHPCHRGRARDRRLRGARARRRGLRGGRAPLMVWRASARRFARTSTW